jgi:hypothetical protein
MRFVVCVQSYKKDSPSSGLFRVKVYNKHGMAQRNGTGMFPREVMNRFPLLPLEEEGRLNDMPLRENFVERVFAYYRWTEVLEEEPTPGGLVKFHTAHKLTLMAHPHQGRQPVALHRDGPPCRGCWKAGLGRTHCRVWGHAHGGPRCDGHTGQACQRTPAPAECRLFGGNGLSQEPLFQRRQARPTCGRLELLGLIEDYRQGLLPLIVALTLLKHHLNRHPVPEWVPACPRAVRGCPAQRGYTSRCTSIPIPRS